MAQQAAHQEVREQLMELLRMMTVRPAAPLSMQLLLSLGCPHSFQATHSIAGWMLHPPVRHYMHRRALWPLAGGGLAVRLSTHAFQGAG